MKTLFAIKWAPRGQKAPAALVDYIKQLYFKTDTFPLSVFIRRPLGSKIEFQRMPLSPSTQTVYLRATNAYSYFIDQYCSCYNWKPGRFLYQSVGRLKRDDDGAQFPPKESFSSGTMPGCSLHTDFTVKDYCLYCKCTNVQFQIGLFNLDKLLHSFCDGLKIQILSSQTCLQPECRFPRYQRSLWWVHIVTTNWDDVQTQHMTNRDSYWTVSSYRLRFSSDRL